MTMPAREIFIRIALVIMGLLTATPVSVLFNPAQLASYGVFDPEPITLSMLQHRGLLQLALGAALVYAAFKPDIRIAVAITTIVTKGGGQILSWTRPDGPTNLVVMIFDPLCIVFLAWLLVDIWRQSRPVLNLRSEVR